MKKNNITAIIPARSGSRRLPNKNILPFDNSNLLVRKIRQLKEVSEIDKIVVSSDSEKYLKMAQKEGVEVHKRELRYADEISTSFGEVVAHICKNTTGKHIIWATCTSPFVDSKDYTEAIKIYFKKIKEGYDSLMSVQPFKRYIWNEKGPLNYELGINHVPSQDLEQLYFVTDGILIAPRKKMIEWNYFHGTSPYKYPMGKIKSTDIDDETDFKIAKSLL